MERDLISMTAFNNQQRVRTIENHELLNNILNYNNFIIRNLELGLFIPTDKEGNVLEKPTHYDEWLSTLKGGFVHDYDISFYSQYQEALDRVVFEGVKVSDGFGTWWIVINGQAKIDIKGKTIEDLTDLGLKIKENHYKRLIG